MEQICKIGMMGGRQNEGTTSGRRVEGTSIPTRKVENSVIGLGTRGPTVLAHGGSSDPMSNS